jgi:hypothetical protein
MAQAGLEARVAVLEGEVELLERRLPGGANHLTWWDRIAGVFAGDEMFEDAVRHAQAYRSAQRPPADG